MRRVTFFLSIFSLLLLVPFAALAQDGKPTTVPTTPTPTRSISGALNTLQQSTLPSAGSCVVFTTQANSAALRVGPGTNRSSVAFLPANTEVDVTGRIELDDGSIWYQLDKAQAAPRSAANEVWVAQETVEEDGDCDRVGETDAPPIIPGVPRSTAVPGGSSSSGGGNSGDGGSAPATGAVIPQTGNWLGSFNATTNASCQGYSNVTIPSIELLDDLTDNYYFAVAGSGNSFTDGLDTFTRAAGTNMFEGFWTFDNGTNGFARMEFSASNRGSGVITFNFNIDGIPCSATTAFSLTR